MSDGSPGRAGGDDVALREMLLRAEGRREAFGEVIESIRSLEAKALRASGLHPGLAAARRRVVALERDEREAQLELRRRA